MVLAHSRNHSLGPAPATNPGCCLSVLPAECLYAIWWLLPNHDLVRCERVSKIWRESIRAWSKVGLGSRFGRHRYRDIAPSDKFDNNHNNTSESNANDSSQDNDNAVFFNSFKYLARQQKAVEAHKPIYSFRFRTQTASAMSRHFVVWTEGELYNQVIRWMKVPLNSSNTLPLKADPQSCHEVSLAALAGDVPGDMFNCAAFTLLVNNNGFLFIELKGNDRDRGSQPMAAILLYSLMDDCTVFVARSERLVHSQLDYAYPTLWTSHRISPNLIQTFLAFSPEPGVWEFVDIKKALKARLDQGHTRAYQPWRIEKGRIGLMREARDILTLRDRIYLVARGPDLTSGESFTIFEDGGEKTWSHQTCLPPSSFPAKARRSGICEIHESNLFAHYIKLWATRADTFAYQVYEIWSKFPGRRAERELVRVLRIKWPKQTVPRNPRGPIWYRPGFLFHEPFSGLTWANVSNESHYAWRFGSSMSGEPQYSWRFCSLERLDHPPLEFIDLLNNGGDYAFIDEFYDCHIGDKFEEALPGLFESTNDEQGEVDAVDQGLIDYRSRATLQFLGFCS